MSDFQAFYQKHAPEVYRFALYLSSNRGEAEDITSETFVRAWASAERIDAATIKGYLFTIARNLFLQRLRKRSREVELAGEFRAGGTDPHEQAETKEALSLVLAELANLPEVRRTALLLHAVEGMPYEEIARVLGLSLAGVKVKIYRARMALSAVRNV